MTNRVRRIAELVVGAIQNIGRKSLPKDAAEFVQSLNLIMQFGARKPQ